MASKGRSHLIVAGSQSCQGASFRRLCVRTRAHTPQRPRGARHAVVSVDLLSRINI